MRETPLTLHARQCEVAKELCEDGALPSAAEAYAAWVKVPQDWRWPLPGSVVADFSARGMDPEFLVIANRVLNRTQWGIQLERYLARMHEMGVPTEYLLMCGDRRIEPDVIIEGWVHGLPLEYLTAV